VTEKLPPPVMMGLPLASCAAMRKVATWPAVAAASPAPLAWQHFSATWHENMIAVGTMREDDEVCRHFRLHCCELSTAQSESLTRCKMLQSSMYLTDGKRLTARLPPCCILSQSSMGGSSTHMHNRLQCSHLRGRGADAVGAAR